MATINEPIQLLQFVNDNLKPKEKEKKKNGEVFTPIILIDEMLDKLDENYRKQHNSSIFADKSLKWYDPAVGIGNFPIIIYMRLMVGLADSISDEEDRKRHILENMLYMSELNPNNTLVCKRVFCGDKYKLNLYEGDSLKLDVTKEWGTEKFDIIIGNPPYNEGKTGKGGKKHLDDGFTKHSLKLLKDKDSYLLFITKTYWRGLSSDAYGDIIDKQIILTKTFDFINNPFNENVLVCYFLLKNEEKHKETIFEFSEDCNKGIIINDMNIYFLYRDYFNYFKLLKEKYGSFEDVTRSTKTSGSNYLLIRHSTPEVLEQKNAPKDDKYYVITDPNMLTKYFFTSKIYQDMRNIGRFTGFTTSKSIFYDIPNFNNIMETEKQDVLNKLKIIDKSFL